MEYQISFGFSNECLADTKANELIGEALRRMTTRLLSYAKKEDRTPDWSTFQVTVSRDPLFPGGLKFTLRVEATSGESDDRFSTGNDGQQS